MLDFKNYFSPAVFLCGVEAVVLSSVHDTTSTAPQAGQGFLRSMDKQKITPVGRS